MKKIKIYIIQFSIKSKKTDENLVKIKKILCTKKIKNNSIIALPELFPTGFVNPPFNYAQTLNGEVVSFMKNISIKYKSYVLGSLLIRKNKKVFNCAIVLNPNGKIIYNYKKIHLFPLTNEHKILTPGNNLTFFEVNGKRFSCLICYDLRFPELFNILSQHNVIAVFLPSNWPQKRISHFKTLLKARSIENQIYTIGINRTGKDKYNLYNGNSCAFSPLGNELLLMGKNENIASLEIDLSILDKLKRIFPFEKSKRYKIYKKYFPYGKAKINSLL